MTSLLSVNGYDYTNLRIIDYVVKMEVLDGEGTGRSKAYGWPLIRDPQGVIVNLNVEIAATNSNEPEFVRLWKVCKSMGTTEFARVKFIDPTGEYIEQDMYLTASELRARRVERDGTVYNDTLKIAFIAKTGI